MKTFDLFTYSDKEPCVIALGFFDCIHLGHKRVISRAVSIARSLSVKSAVFLFRNNIYELLGLDKAPLLTFEERLAEIEKLGVEEVFFVDADRAFLDASPDEFISFLKDRLNVLGVVCGEDYSYGKKGEGKPEELVRAFPNGKNEIVSLYRMEGEKIGSGRVKELLREGNVRGAALLLGRCFSIKGLVGKGRNDGAKIGFPTLNLSDAPSDLKFGVYFTNTILNGRTYASVTNVGPHPTFGDWKSNVETHLIDFNGDAYGKEVVVEFLDYARDLKAFDTVEELVRTISEDVRKRGLL